MRSSMILLCLYAASTVSSAEEVCSPGDVSGACATGGSGEDDSTHLLQTRSRTATQQTDQSVKPPTSWVADAWRDCRPVCDEPGHGKLRTVKCKSFLDGEELADEMCTGAKPAEYETCNCGTVVCAESGPCVEAPKVMDKFLDTGKDEDFVQLGCLAFVDGDSGSSPTVGKAPYDEACIDGSEKGICRSGLPFYRMHSDAMDPGLCFEFCIGKGLDVAGLVLVGRSYSECRCGASVLNEAVWERLVEDGGKPAPAWLGRLLPLDLEGTCQIEVYRYRGHFVDGALPFELASDITESDAAYLDSIVTGRTVGLPESEDETEDVSLVAAEHVPLAASEGASRALPPPEEPGWKRNCWPDNCSPANGLWSTRQSSPPPGVANNFQEYVVIKYMFKTMQDDGTLAPGTDGKRRDAFQAAADKWRENTCINLIETTVTQEADMTVGNIKPTGERRRRCSAMLGATGHRRRWINLGWCKDNSRLGSMIHEIGHAIGMNHEQKRADAQQEYHGKGPHLKVYWQNMVDSSGKDWSSQYKPDTDSYIGSANDGPHDPTHGYAPYDFESIMHYPGGAKFDTIPPEKEKLTGNRQHLMASDIEQINDMYQCKPQLPPACGGALGALWQIEGTGCVVDSSKCLTSANFPQPYNNNDKCTVTPCQPGQIGAESFYTEKGYDKLTINGQTYHGTKGPIDVKLTGPLTWSADGSETKKGWRICPKSPPTPAPEPCIAWQVKGKGCVPDGLNCLQSKNYPKSYGNGEKCTAKAASCASGVISVESFNTEKNYDKLTINGKTYDGKDGPIDVEPTGPLTWSADYSETKSGWKICLGG